MTGRAVPEWVGKTPDAKVPPRVRLRIWERECGICHISKRKIQPGEAWELDHKIALANGGKHCESNLFPALKDKHREKTKADVAEKSKVASVAKHHVGIKRDTSRPIQSAPLPASGKTPRIVKTPLKPRKLYR